MVAQRALGEVNEENTATLNKLSTGMRISKASDDAAGLAISEKLRGQIRSSQQAVRNAGDAISLVQIAEGGLGELTNILIRLRELSMQSASDTISDIERGFTDIEFQSLLLEMERITMATEFNGKRLLDGSGDAYDLQIGYGNDDFIDRITFNAGELNVRNAHLGINNLSVSSKENAQDGLESIDEAVSMVVGNRASIGALQSRLGSTIRNLRFSIENQSLAKSQIADTDYAIQTSKNVQENILIQAGTSVLAQANSQGQAALSLLN